MPRDDDRQPATGPGDAAPPSVEVHVFGQYRDAVSEPALAAIARRAVQLEAAPHARALSLVIADDATVRELNAAYRGIDATTDVLAFAFGSEGEYYGEGEPVFRQDDGTDFVTPQDADAGLGEVIVSYPQAERQAREAGRALDAELAHLVAHGVLHLLGYDHENDEDEAEMRAREILILGEHPHDE